MESSKLEMILRFVMHLSNGVRYNVEQLAERFETSTRSIYRYLKAVEEAGFVLNRTDGRYSLAMDSSTVKHLNKLIHFSDEEAYILYSTLESMAGQNAVKERLIRKLHALYDHRILEKHVKNKSINTINHLAEAIVTCKRVKLINYRSSHSNSVRTRVVEPFEFQNEYMGVWCYDIDNQTNKLFKLDRIETIELTNSQQTYSARHKVPFIDVFRISGSEPLCDVKAQLSLMAYNLLIEEYPLAINHITIENNCYFFDAPVASFLGIGRFILGLPGEVRIISPQDLIDDIKNRSKYFSTDRF